MEELTAVQSPHISHWDVPDMTEVLREAFELVERQLLTGEDFRDFTFTNAVRLHAGANPDFVRGTAAKTAAAHGLSLD